MQQLSGLTGAGQRLGTHQHNPRTPEGEEYAGKSQGDPLSDRPDDAGRWIEIRSEAELTEENAGEHLDEIIRQYTKHPHYYGHIFPFEQKEKETRVICKIRSKKINIDAIHS